MAHNEHNKTRNSGGFALIIFGAMLLFLAPYVNPSNPALGIIALIGGIIIGGVGFYLKFISTRERKI
jgi:hypothetical protein